ncbi:MAG: Dihydrouridine synthase like protein [uncultured bacterium]|nr:MAG: Dihydrouridine synthase like protein [uncultured bacterium]
MKKKKVYLAPMDDINDIAFRMVCKKAGAKRTYTNMIFPSLNQKLYLQDKPVIQVVCKNEKGIASFMRKYDSIVSGWNLNLGCPGKLAEDGGYGAFLTDIRIIEKILIVMRCNTKKPLSIKLRKTPSTKKIIGIANKYCEEIAIHPRTIEQGYMSVSDVRFAKSLRKETGLPIIYSGDIDENNCDRFLNYFDGVMIGRSAIGNPDIFSKIYKNKKKINFLNYLEFASKYKLPLQQILFQAINFNNRIPGGERYILKIIKARSIKRLRFIFAWTYKRLLI